MVIAVGFIGRENWLVGPTIAAVGVYYVVRVFLGPRLKIFASGNREVEHGSATSNPRWNGRPGEVETADLRSGLEAMLVDLLKRMIATRSFFMLIGGIAAITFSFNWQLAVAMLPFAAFFGFLYFKNARAVSMLQKNL